MNKNKLFFIVSLLALISIVTWSCKDEFSAEDQLRLQAELDAEAKKNTQEKDSIALSIQIYNASVSTHSTGGKTSGIQGASGLSVKIAAGGTILSGTTGEEGIVNFWVQPGAISGTVSGAGFATANFTLTVTEAEDTESSESGEQSTNASVVLPVFANTGTTTAKVSGLVTYEGNLLNSTQETVPNGTAVTFKPTPTSLQAYYTGITSTQADIDAYSFEGNFIATTTNGLYSITLPSGANGLDYTHTFNEFTADQSIAINNYLNEPAGSVRAVVAIRTNFGANVGAGANAPVVLPVQLDIAAPPPAGTGATVNLRLLPQTVTGAGAAPFFTVMAMGNGYPLGSVSVPVTVNGGDFDATVPGATAAVITANTNSIGQVTSINITNAGFGYRSRPTLTIGGGGSGAVVRLNWTSPIASHTFANGASTITAGGSGYHEANTPNILVTAQTSTGESTSFTVATSVSSGAVVGLTPGVETVSSITSAVVVSPTRTNAIAGAATINSAGELASLAALTDGGSGYANTPAPTVTVRSLRSGGSGALVIAEMNNNHTVSGLNIVSRGSGYSTLTNANFPTNAPGFTPASASITINAGQERVLDAYYGVGKRTRDVQ